MSENANKPQLGTNEAAYDDHKILDFKRPPMSVGCGSFYLGFSKPKIVFDQWGIDIGCKRITADALYELFALYSEWKKGQNTKVIQ